VFSDQAAIAEHVNGWRVGEAVPGGVADVLRVARMLLVDSYFVYEYSLVAVTWGLLAAEASLRGCLSVDDQQRDQRPFGTLVEQARQRELITDEEKNLLIKVVALRNKIVHGHLRPNPAPESYSAEAALMHLEGAGDGLPTVASGPAGSGVVGHGGCRAGLGRRTAHRGGRERVARARSGGSGRA
jgi:hypothetical protein